MCKSGCRERFKGFGSENIVVTIGSDIAFPDLVHSNVSPDVRKILCIVAKNYTSWALVKPNIYDEIEEAELMMPDGEGYESVLRVACTQYHNVLEKRFDGSGFQVYGSEKIKKPHEVILLDLMSPKRRLMFYDLEFANEIAGLYH
jgi:hypothetical protein